MRKTVFAIARNENLAQQIVDQLRNANFTVENISILVSQGQQGKSGSSQKPGQQKSKAPWTSKGEVQEESMESYGQKGSVGQANLSGSLGKLKNISIVNIQGLGTFISAGPLKGFFEKGTFAQALTNCGVTKQDLQKFEEKVKSGCVLIAVNLQNNEEIEKVKQVLRAAKAEEIVHSQEAQVARKGH